MKTTLRNLLEKHRDKIEEVGDESGMGDGYWIYLRAGWRCDEVHSVHEWSMKDLLRAFRWVERCDCEDCKKDLSRAKISA